MTVDTETNIQPNFIVDTINKLREKEYQHVLKEINESKTNRYYLQPGDIVN